MKKILVGVSGGVDSLSAVLYFKNLNFEVFPYFLILSEKNLIEKEKVVQLYKDLALNHS